MTRPFTERLDIPKTERYRFLPMKTKGRLFEGAPELRITLQYFYRKEEPQSRFPVTKRRLIATPSAVDRQIQ